MVMALKVTPVLGVVQVLEGGVLEAARSAHNNTKWLFDVEGDADSDLVIQLIDTRGQTPHNPDIAHCSLSARSSEYYDVKPFQASREGGLIRIGHGAKGSVRYSVMIDTMHTAMR
jgi:hypothetical protein